MCWGFDGGSFLTPTPVTGAITAPVLSPGLYATHMSALEGNMVFIGSGATEPVGMAGAASTCTYGGTGACYATDFVWSANGATSPAVSVAAGGLGPLGMLTMCWVTREGTAQCSWNPYVGAVTMVSPAVSVFAGMEAAEGDFACAILANGSVDCWGANTYGELGIGSTSATPIAAVTAAPLPSSVTTMALSRGTITAAHACAVAGGSVYCAGSNASGQLGNMANYATTSFGLVSGVSNAVAVAAGQAHTCALDGEGFVHCWGDNDDGELGDGTTTTRFAAVAVQPW
jgi:alpha-tubulin suppressor-like RCC1 family protein